MGSDWFIQCKELVEQLKKGFKNCKVTKNLQKCKKKKKKNKIPAYLNFYYVLNRPAHVMSEWLDEFRICFIESITKKQLF